MCILAGNWYLACGEVQLYCSLMPRMAGSGTQNPLRIFQVRWDEALRPVRKQRGKRGQYQGPIGRVNLAAAGIRKRAVE